MGLKPERILLFIPMYNCERQIPRVIAQLTPDVRALLSEVIVVDNRSTDGSIAAAKRAVGAIADLPAKVLRNDDNYGLGGSHKVAFNYALANGFDYCIVLHGDDQGGIDDIVPLIRAGRHREHDCLLGARFMKGAKLPGYSTFRTLGNLAFNWLYSAVSGVRIRDLGSGLNLYSVPKLADRSYLRNANGLTFNYYMILRSIAAGWRIHFFPLVWREEDQVSNVKLFRQAVTVFMIALEYALRRKRLLAEDHSGRSTAYTSTVVFESPVSMEGAKCS
jgi:glycosyltransferase involved in cell wall biosynthesis